MEEEWKEYEKINPCPIKPKRVWVSESKGHATKKGSQWINDCRKWELAFLEWYISKIKEENNA